MQGVVGKDDYTVKIGERLEMYHINLLKKYSRREDEEVRVVSGHDIPGGVFEVTRAAVVEYEKEDEKEVMGGCDEVDDE